MRRLLAISRDLFFTSKLKAAVQNLPAEDGENWIVVFARNEAEFRGQLSLEHFEAALIDTQANQYPWEKLIKEARDAGVPVLAFGSHAHPEPLKRARAAGAYKAVANSAVLEKLGELLRKREATLNESDREE